MSFLFFLLQAVVISLSGIMMPGPITAASIGEGTRRSWAGVAISIGHGLVEFPLIGALYAGVIVFADITSQLKSYIFIIGAFVLILMGADFLRRARNTTQRERYFPQTSLLLAGAGLTAANPYFLIWWLTIGAALITEAGKFGTAGLLTFVIVHWLCDVSWYWFLSGLAFRGVNFFGTTFQKWLFIFTGIVLLGLGGIFGVSGVSALVK